MKKIYKKVKKEYFDAVVEGKKRFEIRLADFDYKPGDILVLQEQVPGKQELNGRELECEILFPLNTKIAEEFWSKKEIEEHGLVVLSIRKHFNFK